MGVYFTNLKKDLVNRIVESSLSVLGINNENLREHLYTILKGDESVINGPVFESMFEWSKSNVQIKDLATKEHQSLLSPELLDALDKSSHDEDCKGGDDCACSYVFKRDFYPYKHQLKAWSGLLSEKPTSHIITSGTGSGKTECFMVPILEDLIRIKNTGESLTGVRALFLYPLNALINSQQERLNAWTRHFNGDIRYCLYNGNTPERLKGQQRQAQARMPNQVLSRELMRQDPAPMLITNGTMLEYMLIRQADAPIIEQSKGKLRWIVLDEAHTYVGSQAAELALQLKRVMQAFEVKPEDIRFVATSATIAGSDSEEKLKKYLSDLAGIDTSQVVFVPGERSIPKLKTYQHSNITLDDIARIDTNKGFFASQDEEGILEVSKERFEALSQSKIATLIRDLIVKNNKPSLTDDILQTLRTSDIEMTEQELFNWVDICTYTKPSKDSEAFLKLRAHYFQRTLSGIWACINPNCSKKIGTPLEKDWPYGYVYSKHKQHCSGCKSLVLELNFCSDCNYPHLKSEVMQGMLHQSKPQVRDDFLLSDIEEHSDAEMDSDAELEINDSSDDLSNNTSEVCYLSRISNPKSKNYREDKISLAGEFNSNDKDLTNIYVLNSDQEECISCVAKASKIRSSIFRGAYLGVPFYAPTIIPSILEYCPDFETQKNNTTPLYLPALGRRLITFSDSRQGTARLSILMQQEAERAKFRGVVVKNLKNHVKEVDDRPIDMNSLYALIGMENPSPDELRDIATKFRDANETLSNNLFIVADAIENNKKKVVIESIRWPDLINQLSKDEDISVYIKNRYREFSFKDFGDNYSVNTLCKVLLLSEFARRPKLKNNLETLGLTKIVYPQLSQINVCPEKWSEYGFTLHDWKDYLKVCLDFYIREHSFVYMDELSRRWIGKRFYPKTLLSPDSNKDPGGRYQKWPQVKLNSKSKGNKITKLLWLAASLDLNSKKDIAIINDWLKSAWKALTEVKLLSEVTGDEGFSLDLEKVSFSLLDEGYVCPITNKFLDVTFRYITPYLPYNIETSEGYICTKVKMPKVWELVGDGVDNIKAIRSSIKDSEVINDFRKLNLWNSLSDRIVEGGFYYNTAEHSAQQNQKKLQKYEKLFREGKQNVLNCSTTMEMGVDIGGISAVVMNNIPPHPANYLQRAGRAGRSRQARALAYSICKSSPHDMLVFNTPNWAFDTPIPPPYVEFGLNKIVQRHVNSYLLSYFLNAVIGTTDNDRHRLNLAWFYGEEDSNNAVSNRFLGWLKAIPLECNKGIQFISKGTSSENDSVHSFTEKAYNLILELQNRWQTDFEYIEEQYNSIKDQKTSFAYKLQIDKKRHCDESLLKELAVKGFLPGYGFPTDVVTLDTDTYTDYLNNKDNKDLSSEREDNLQRRKSLPSRNLSFAIREYAPGADIVIDGKVYRSAGISLNWNEFFSNSSEAQKLDIAWRCQACGQTGYNTSISEQSDLICTNSSCRTPIDNDWKLKTIEPTGFVTDYFAVPSNNLSERSYVPVRPAWISAKGNPIPLPSEDLGFMISDTNGTVYNYSAGLYGHGFEICLSCGRSESQQDDNKIRLLEDHKPPRPTKYDKDEDGRRYCDGRNKIATNVYIGSYSTTDVFQLILKKPHNGEFIPPITRQDKQSGNNSNGKTIATTLAVAARRALTQILGISVNEVSYGVKQLRLKDGTPTSAIQLYDTVSGGAGFSSSAKYHIQEILESLISILKCRDNCESYCPTCLLEFDSNHDINHLDRKLALEWLSEEFIHHVKLPENLEALLPKAKYCPVSIKQKLLELHAKSPKRLVIFLNEDFENWDLSLGLIKKHLFRLLAESNSTVVIGIPKRDLSSDIKTFLQSINSLGISICYYESEYPVVIQAQWDDKTITIANSDSLCRQPGHKLFESDKVNVISESELDFSLVEIDVSQWVVSDDRGASARLINFQEDFNGRLSTFGENFWKRLLDGELSKTPLKQLLQSQKLIEVTYTDRYIASPSSILLLTEILRPLQLDEASLSINTLQIHRSSNGYQQYLWHDWDDESDYLAISKAWIENFTKVSPIFNMYGRDKKLDHSRVLSLTFDNDNSIDIYFDQGVGYWTLKCSHGSHIFNFSLSQEEQVQGLIKAYKSASVENQPYKSIIIASFNDKE